MGKRVLRVEDGPLLSSAGVTAGIDLALHCIARHAGEALAAEVAQVMVVFHRRGAGDPERSPLLAGRSHLHPAVHRVQNAVGERPAEDWSLERLAAEAHVTPRHLGRLFATHVGCTPRDFVEQVIMGVGRPVIILPAKGVAGLSLDEVVMGWDGGREAARAAFDALPVLKAAKKVRVVRADPQKDPALRGGVPATVLSTLPCTLVVQVPDVAAYENFTRRFLYSNPDVAKFRTMVVLDPVKFEFRYDLPEEKAE